MFLGEISFCDKICYNIKSDDYKEKVLNELDNQCNFKIIRKHHEEFNYNYHMNTLQTKPYLISVRSNGNPYLLYLTRYNYISQSIFIDKKIQSGYFYPRMILSNLMFDESLFENTLLDGEMVKTNDNVWLFLINDILLYKGKCTSNLTLIKRLELLHSLLLNEYKRDDMDYCKIYVKQYFKYKELPLMQQFVESISYSSRGLYFKPLNQKNKLILYNFDKTLIKKTDRKKFGEFRLNNPQNTETNQDNPSEINPLPPLHNDDPPPNNTSINMNKPEELKDNIFYVKKTSNPDVYELYKTVSSPECLGIACVMKLNTSQLLQSIFNKTALTQRLPFICTLNTKMNKWTPIKLSSQ